jgi:hypothetical protein
LAHPNGHGVPAFPPRQQAACKVRDLVPRSRESRGGRIVKRGVKFLPARVWLWIVQLGHLESPEAAVARGHMAPGIPGGWMPLHRQRDHAPRAALLWFPPAAARAPSANPPASPSPCFRWSGGALASCAPPASVLAAAPVLRRGGRFTCFAPRDLDSVCFSLWSILKARF